MSGLGNVAQPATARRLMDDAKSAALDYSGERHRSRQNLYVPVGLDVDSGLFRRRHSPLLVGARAFVRTSVRGIGAEHDVFSGERELCPPGQIGRASCRE